MQNEINLLKTDKKVREKKSSFFKLCLIILTVVVFFTAAEIIYTVYLKNQLSNTLSSQSATLKQIGTIEGKRVKFQTLRERLKAIATILPARKVFQERVGIIAENIPSSASVDGIDFSKNTITIHIYAQNLSTINQFLETGLDTISKQKVQPVKSIVVSSVGVTKAPSGYGTAATITF